MAAAALHLARTLNKRNLREEERDEAVVTFFSVGFHLPSPTQPAWLDYVRQALCEELHLSVGALATRLGLNAAWLGQAYRTHVGETILQTSARIRVERAAYVLRSTNTPLAQVAIDAGFCDQSHMNRCFRALVGRTPSQLRHDWVYLGKARPEVVAEEREDLSPARSGVRRGSSHRGIA